MKKDQEACPVCDSKTLIVRELNYPFLLSELEKYYSEKIDIDLSLVNYKVRRCESCSLEFASPMQGGSSEFYTWITNHKGYYPDIRWEWQEVISLIKHQSVASANLLEVGCGSGKFLELSQKNGIKAVGLDTTLTSVQQCKDKGLEVYPSTLEEFISSSDGNQHKFDYVVSFHCLEHVDDPKSLVKAMCSLLKPTGSIFLSTPYSPMSFETSWFDPLNYPPHHMTRWNTKSYGELAKQVGLKAEFIMPRASKLIDRVLSTLNYAWNSPANLVGRRAILLAALSKPHLTLIEIFRQLNREKLNNEVAADVVLVELTAKN
jgi:2-polyprenyl-3-methyl-5-hydroxy-6-metoxy-1,4-benzoquinol methylase